MPGSIVIVQMDNGNEPLNLKEVKAFGRPGNNTQLNIVINFLAVQTESVDNSIGVIVSCQLSLTHLLSH